MTSDDTIQYCTFTLANLLFAVDVSRVQEVLNARTMTAVPRSDPRVRGLLNLRGRVVTVLDLRRRLGLPDDPAVEPAHVVVRTNDGPISLQVDAVGDVIDIAGRDLTAAPTTLPRSIRELVRGIQPLSDTLLLVLDVQSVLDFSPSHDVSPVASA